MKRTTVQATFKNGEKRVWSGAGEAETGKLVLDEQYTITFGNMKLWLRGSTEGGHMNVICGSVVETQSLSVTVEEV
jgi:hypothetical protein